MIRIKGGFLLFLSFSTLISVMNEQAFCESMKSGLIAPDAVPTKMVSDFQARGMDGPPTEGPATDQEGNVYFTATFAEKIYKWSWENGNVSLYREKTGMANGMMFDARGRLVMCELGNRRVTRDDMKGNITILADACGGKKLYNPNDLWIDPKGGIYFSHQYFPLSVVGMPAEHPGREPEDASNTDSPSNKKDAIPFSIPDDVDKDELGILYISPDGQTVTRVTTDNTSPNGLIGTPDGKILYVGDRGAIYSYRINDDGTLSDKNLFCHKLTDGMAMDERHNIYLTCDKSIYIYSPAGEIIDEIVMPVSCSNLTFGGKDRKTLFITSRGYNYTLEMAVRGAPTALDLAAKLTAPGAELQKIETGYTFTEGPAVDAEGNVFFTDIPNQSIYRWNHANGNVSLYRDNSGEANGLMFDSLGRLVICEMGNRRVTRDDLKGNISILADSCDGQKLNMPNDLWIDGKGGIYFSDFLGPGNAPEGGLQVYYVLPGAQNVIRVTDDLSAPNGLIGAPDGKTLYITDPGAGKTFAYVINPDGTLSNKRLFCDQFTDGMAMDERNNLYFSGDSSITVYASDGTTIKEIAVPERSANLTFGGKDRKTLFITAMTSVYSIKMSVRGAAMPVDLAERK